MPVWSLGVGSEVYLACSSCLHISFSNTQRLLGSEENRKSQTLVQGCRVGKDAFLSVLISPGVSSGPESSSVSAQGVVFVL